MVALMCLIGFVAVVGTLAFTQAPRTRGRSCCAPADPLQDLRMRRVDGDEAAGSSLG